LYSFISPIPGFNGDIPILAIPVSTKSPGDESVSNPSTGASAGVSKTQAGKRKATTNPTQKKAKKATGKSFSGLKINEPAPRAPPAPTPPSGPRKRIPIHWMKWYICHDDSFFYSQLLCYVWTSTQSTPRHQPRLFFKECPSRWRVPKGGEALECSC
jgi:hypothetical protein